MFHCTHMLRMFQVMQTCGPYIRHIQVEVSLDSCTPWHWFVVFEYSPTSGGNEFKILGFFGKMQGSQVFLGPLYRWTVVNLFDVAPWQPQPELMEPQTFEESGLEGQNLEVSCFIVYIVPWCFMHSASCDHCWTINGEVLEHARKELIVLRTELLLAWKGGRAICFIGTPIPHWSSQLFTCLKVGYLNEFLSKGWHLSRLFQWSWDPATVSGPVTLLCGRRMYWLL